MLAEVTTILREHHLALPSDLALLIKAFISLEGMGRGLDPDFHMASEAQPMLRQVVRARYRPQALAMRGWQALRRRRWRPSASCRTTSRGCCAARAAAACRWPSTSPTSSASATSSTAPPAAWRWRW